MIPTITNLTKERLVTIANDVKPLESSIDGFIEDVVKVKMESAANDVEDSYQKTMDRIIKTHNGHSKKYRDQKGRFIKREDAVANDKVDFYEKTMDRIMDRHNGHERGEVEAANVNERLVSTGPNIAPLHEYLNSNENQELSGPVDTSREIIPLLQVIEENTLRTSEVLENIEDILHDMTDSQGVDNLKARERDLEEYHRLMAQMAGHNSSMAPEGNQKGKEEGGLLSNLVKGAGGLTTAAIGAAGVVADKISDYLPQQPENPGGGRGPDAAPKSSPAPTSTKKADATGAGNGYEPASAIPKPVKGDKSFQAEVTRVSKKYNLREDDLYRVMSFETGGTFSPSVKNKSGSGATGLIQFMPKTARGLGTNTGDLARMSRSQQMKYVDKYFAQNKLDKKAKNPSIDDLYMTIYKPKAVGKGSDYVHARRGSKEYAQNAGFDKNGNRDGAITSAELSANIRDHSVSGVGSYKAPTKGAQLNKQSAQSGARGNNVTVNNSSSTTVNNSTSTNKAQPKHRVPSARPTMKDIMGQYFGGPKY